MVVAPKFKFQTAKKDSWVWVSFSLKDYSLVVPKTAVHEVLPEFPKVEIETAHNAIHFEFWWCQ